MLTKDFGKMKRQQTQRALMMRKETSMHFEESKTKEVRKKEIMLEATSKSLNIMGSSISSIYLCIIL